MPQAICATVSCDEQTASRVTRPSGSNVVTTGKPRAQACRNVFGKPSISDVFATKRARSNNCPPNLRIRETCMEGLVQRRRAMASIRSYKPSSPETGPPTMELVVRHQLGELDEAIWPLELAQIGNPQHIDILRLCRRVAQWALEEPTHDRASYTVVGFMTCFVADCTRTASARRSPYSRKSQRSHRFAKQCSRIAIRIAGRTKYEGAADGAHKTLPAARAPYLHSYGSRPPRQRGDSAAHNVVQRGCMNRKPGSPADGWNVFSVLTPSYTSPSGCPKSPTTKLTSWPSFASAIAS